MFPLHLPSTSRRIGLMGSKNICCPEGMVCHSTSFSPSGIFCCADGSQCLANEDQPARCDGPASPCDKNLGGGCCAPGTQCAAAGCLKMYRAAPGFASTVLGGNQSPPPPPSTSVRATTKTTRSGTSTVTGGITVMTPKIGEMAQSAGVRGVGCGFGFSSWPSLEMVALGFAVVFSYVMVLRG